MLGKKWVFIFPGVATSQIATRRGVPEHRANIEGSQGERGSAKADNSSRVLVVKTEASAASSNTSLCLSQFELSFYHLQPNNSMYSSLILVTT